MFDPRDTPGTSTISVIDYVLESWQPIENTIAAIKKHVLPTVRKERKDAWIRVTSVLTGEIFLFNTASEVYKLTINNQVTDKRFDEFIKSLGA